MLGIDLNGTNIVLSFDSSYLPSRGMMILLVPFRSDAQRRRLIPTHVKLEVWKRDGGKCTKCDAIDELHLTISSPTLRAVRRSRQQMFSFFARVIT